jgi:hypothetical protein
MSDIYDIGLRKIIKCKAEEIGLTLREGVYIQCSGPNYESPEEIKMYGMLGADAVGMSTACEAIAARHHGHESLRYKLHFKQGRRNKQNKAFSQRNKSGGGQDCRCFSNACERFRCRLCGKPINYIFLFQIIK